MKILQEILRFFEKFLEFFRNFSENLENVGNMHLKGGSGAEPPESSKIFKKLLEKSMETGKILKIYMNF